MEVLFSLSMQQCRASYLIIFSNLGFMLDIFSSLLISCPELLLPTMIILAP